MGKPSGWELEILGFCGIHSGGDSISGMWAVSTDFMTAVFAWREALAVLERDETPGQLAAFSEASSVLRLKVDDIINRNNAKATDEMEG